MIIKLESDKEEAYGVALAAWIEATTKDQDPDSIAKIRSLWDNESWESIVEKFNTEGSTWIVWWVDGVRAFIAVCQG